MLLGADRAAADPRDPQRPRPPRPRRARRERGSAGGPRARRSRRLVQGGQGPAGRGSHGAGRAQAPRSSRSSITSKTRWRCSRPTATLLFANPAMRPRFTGADGHASRTLLPAGHPYRVAVESALRAPTGRRAADAGRGGRARRRRAADPRAGRARRRRAARSRVMLVARNLTYLAQVESTLELLAQARRAQPADRRHRARDQEPAQRHDDPSRAAEDEGGRDGPTRSSTWPSSRARCGGSTKSCRGC